jgi:hypothetical protein
MNTQEIDLLKVYVMLSPFAVAVLGLGIFWLTGWMDRRERQRHHAAE